MWESIRTTAAEFSIEDTSLIVFETTTELSTPSETLITWWLIDSTERDVPAVAFISASRDDNGITEIYEAETRPDRKRRGLYRILREFAENRCGGELYSGTNMSTEGEKARRAVGGKMRYPKTPARQFTPIPFVMSWTHRLCYSALAESDGTEALLADLDNDGELLEQWRNYLDGEFDFSVE